MTYSPLFFKPNQPGSSVRALQTGYQNGTLSTITKSSPVSVNSSGQIILADVSSEANIKALVGLAALDLPSAASGSVIDQGRLEDITTSFNIGDPIYLGHTPGTLINTKPDIGSASFVAGDWIVFLGVIVQNEFDNAKKDLKLFIQVIGRL